MLRYNRYIVVIIITLNFIGQGNTQTVQLDYDQFFPYVSQNNSSLCWGASLEMVLRYWKPDVTICDECDQIDIRDMYKVKVNPDPYKHQSTSGLNASVIIGTSLFEYRDDYSAILSYYGLHSSQMVNGYPISLTENLIEEEISNCRPLILITDSKAAHVSVLKSYTKIMTGSTTSLVLDIYDPQEAEAVSYLSDSIGMQKIDWLLDDTTNLAVAEIKSFVYEIEESDQVNRGRACTPCVKLKNNYNKVDHADLEDRILSPSRSNLTKTFIENYEKLPLDRNYQLSTRKLLSSICAEEGYFYPLVELSKENFMNIRELDYTVPSGELPSVFEYVAKLEGQPLVLTFYRNTEQKYKLYKVRTTTDVKPIYEDERFGITLNNSGYCRELQQEVVPYTIIKVPSLNLTSYQYEYRGKRHLVILDDPNQGGQDPRVINRLYRKRDYRALEKYLRKLN